LTDKVRELGVGADLAQLEQNAVEQFEKLYKGGEYDPDDTGLLEALADLTDAVRAVASERHAEKVERDKKVSSLADRVRPAPADTEETDENPGDAAPAAPAGTPDTAATEETDPEKNDPVTSGESAPDTAPNGAPEPPATTEPPTSGDGGQPPTDSPAAPPSPAENAPTAVAAAAATTPARRPSTTAAINASRNAVSQNPADGERKPFRSFTITASAEIPEYPFGQNLTVDELAAAAATRFSTLPVGQPASGPIKANVARIHRHIAPEMTLTGNQTDIELIDRIADEKRLPGGSLVKAALTAAAQAPSTYQDVWCTPSETDYTLCPPLATRDGLLDLPTAGMPARGGLRYPVWSQYPDAEQANWHGEVIQYPANPADPGAGLDNPLYFRRLEADGGPVGGLGHTKKCIEGPCVDWAEVRQSLAYLCVTSDILRDRTFPEGIERFTSDVLVHHTHYLNEIYAGYIQAHADPIPAFSVQNGDGQIGSTSLTVVDRLALLVTWKRNRYKMAEDATLEIVAPEWFREFLKRDIEKKQNRPFGAVSNAEIAELFAQYASRVQWIRDWQELGDGAAVGGRIMPPAGWPTTVNLMAFPAGSWVLSEANILQLGVQYDYQLLQENRYSAMFTEDSWLLLNRCNRTFLVQLTDLCANGAVGPTRDACPPAAPAGITAVGEPDSGTSDVETSDDTEKKTSTEDSAAQEDSGGTGKDDTTGGTGSARSGSSRKK
ncbi:major capsid protein, partial [Amycolatopsis sp.]|uniref:major capsid protein n=1 Tax=Amycolatopsis sp. TaxID=37632 RepID=UPI002D7FCC67